VRSQASSRFVNKCNVWPHGPIVHAHMNTG
jgi:hypothetical protein